MFVVLGLLVFPAICPTSRLPGSRSPSCSMLVARPAAVWASTAFSDFTQRERALLGWAGLRGAVPIVLATFVLSSEVPPQRDDLQRRLLRRRRLDARPGNDARVGRAQRLGLTTSAPPLPEPPLEAEAAQPARRSSTSPSPTTTRSPAPPCASSACRATRSSPSSPQRRRTIPPRGSTVIQPGDRLFVVVPERAPPRPRRRLHSLAPPDLGGFVSRRMVLRPARYVIAERLPLASPARRGTAAHQGVTAENEGNPPGGASNACGRASGD